jgi:cell division protease FtsH
MFVGVGASRVRDMFEQAKKNSPCIIFIDEIDAVGRHRGAGLGGGNDEREQTLNQLLVEMDGFEANEGVIIHRGDQPSRMCSILHCCARPFRPPDRRAEPGYDWPREDPQSACAQRAAGAGCGPQGVRTRDARLLRRRLDEPRQRGCAAWLRAVNKRLVTMAEFEDAKDKVMMGAERRTLVMTEEEKKLTAYHEAGHAMVALHVPASDPIHKATIIPRGRALGMVMQLPERDKLSMSFDR